MSIEPVIALRNVTRSFGEHRAVDALDLEVRQGTLLGFLGPNGAGKSTTIRMIMSIIYPDSGDVTVLGHSALDAKDRIGYLPEERGLYRRMRIRDFLRFIAKLKGIDAAGADARATAWLEKLDLEGVLKRRCEELSKGQQQKIQFIASVLHDPDVLILDEPFSGLDPVNRQLLSRVIRDLHAEGRTIVFSTHVLPEAETLCEHILLMDKGRKLLDDTLGSIREQFHPRDLVVERIDPGPAPSVPGTSARADDQDGRRWLLQMDDGVDAQAAMAAALAAAPLRSVQHREPSLEDVFATLVTAGEDA
ncbi:MAG: ATP-binding cassette domain-containing protein [Phycisphaerales bacterium]|nr:ATP-binding cassette domain-containing protein [Phycisphaerales bacterium]